MSLKSLLSTNAQSCYITALLNDILYEKTYTTYRCGQSPWGTFIRHKADKGKVDITIFKGKKNPNCLVVDQAGSDWILFWGLDIKKLRHFAQNFKS